MTTTLREAAEMRRAAIEAREGGNRGDRPQHRRASESEDAPRKRTRVSLDGARVEVRKKSAADDGETHVVGMASVTERGYDMWDEFGPYTEVIGRAAPGLALVSNPSVEFALNHARGGGAPMAATWNGTLALSAVEDGDEPGLAYDANVDPTRSDVLDMVKALGRGDLREASFKFGIVRGQWSPDFTEYRIEEFNLDGGDVSAVNFGANPSASSSLRAAATPKSGLSVVRDGFEVARVL